MVMETKNQKQDFFLGRYSEVVGKVYDLSVARPSDKVLPVLYEALYLIGDGLAELRKHSHPPVTFVEDKNGFLKVEKPAESAVLTGAPETTFSPGNVEE